jgi:hypothetical protein
MPTVPFATESEMPAAFRTRIPRTGLPEWWPHDGQILLRGGARALPPDAVEQMGLAFKRFDGRLNRHTAPMREALDPASAAAFGWRLFERCAASGVAPRKAWGISAVQILGDADTVTRLNQELGKLPVHYAIRALAALCAMPVPTALQLVASASVLDRRLHVRKEAAALLAREAKARNLSADQLADRLVPTLDFDGDGVRTLIIGGRDVCVRLDTTLAASQLVSAPEARDLAVELERVRSTQVERLELALRTRRRWPAADFQESHVSHPLLGRLARGLLWGRYDDDGLTAFRVDGAGSWLDADGRPVDCRGEVELVHPITLQEEALARWQGAFTAVAQPMLQLHRPYFRPGSEEGDAVFAWVRTHAVKRRRVLSLEGRGWRPGPTGGPPHRRDEEYMEWEIGDLLVVLDLGRRDGDEHRLAVQVVGTPEPVAWSEAVYSLWAGLMNPT